MAAEGTPYVDATAVVEDSAQIGADTKIWGQVQVRTGAVVGQRCVVGRGAFLDAGVVVGDDCKIQNHALVYAPAFLEQGVFIGPGAVLTNDRRPRAINPDGSRKERAHWEPVGVTVKAGASIGAGAVCVAPVTIGAWAMVAAGAVVTSDVPDYGLVTGTPARLTGWVGRAGNRLVPSEDGAALRCPDTGEAFRETDGKLVLDQ